MSKSEANVKLNIEKLLQYGIKNELIDPSDVILIRNEYLDRFGMDEPYDGEVQLEEITSLQQILDPLADYAVEKGIITEDTFTYRDIFSTGLMGILTPRQSEVTKKFREIQQKKSIQEAMDYFYRFSKTSNYIRMESIKKNIFWQITTEYGNLHISINLSKPEKDPREIAKLKQTRETNYPKCLLCLENVGYAGRLNHPARHNHRVIPITLDHEQWYIQYSPYVYYNEHCIVFSGEHKPMYIDGQAFQRMFQFVEQIPHYFLGANAGLPIVGGSILSHDHYQGGRERFPIEDAQVDLNLRCQEYADIKASTRHWCISMIRLEGFDQQRLIEFATYILAQWKEYSDENVNILAYSEDETGTLIPHNTVTPIVRKRKDGPYEIDLILRNNRTSELYPDGIFHPHKDLHHIKKENIGVIEVMGLAILPGRLEQELGEIKKILTGQVEYSLDEFENENHMLSKHRPWIQRLIDTYGVKLADHEADQIIRNEVGDKFLAVLKDVSVFKDDEKGKEAFKQFIAHIGFEIIK